MIKRLLLLALTSTLIACIGEDSTETSTETPIELTVTINTESQDYIAIKKSGEWQQLDSNPNTLIKLMSDEVIEIASLCIEGESHWYQHNQLNFSVYDKDTLSLFAKDPIDISSGPSCYFKNATNKVSINNGTTDFTLLKAEAQDINKTSTFYTYNPFDKEISFYVDNSRTDFDLLAIGKNESTGDFYGHRKSNLILNDGESYSIDFNDSYSHLLEVFEPNLIEGTEYSLSYESNTGTEIQLWVDSNTWMKWPAQLSDDTGTYTESWILGSYDTSSMSYTIESAQAGTLSKLNTESAELPLSNDEILLNRDSLSVSMPAITSELEGTIVVSASTFYTFQDLNTYYISSVLQGENAEYNASLIDFNSLPGFELESKFLQYEKLSSARLYIAHLLIPRTLETAYVEYFRYSFNLPIE
jgi:hypothetical protein